MPCERCHEMMAVDHFLDVHDSRGHLWISVWRCLTCGGEAMEEASELVCVHYPGQDELVWCDSTLEAITYIVAENIGQGLSPFTGLQKIINIMKAVNEDNPLYQE